MLIFIYNMSDEEQINVTLIYKEAISGPNHVEWKKAADKEISTIILNESFELVPWESMGNKTILNPVWIFCIKHCDKKKA